MRTSLLLRLSSLLVPLLACGISNGQQSPGPLGIGAGRPIEGSSDPQIQSTKPPRSELQPGIKMHLDPLGKPCVAVTGFSLEKTDFRAVFGGQASELEQKGVKHFENFISAQNHCSRPIKLRVCYYASQDCVPIDVPGYDNRRISLGFSGGTRRFRYQYTEQF